MSDNETQNGTQSHKLVGFDPQPPPTRRCANAMADQEAGQEATDRRYEALLQVSTVIAAQPTVEAILHSLRGVLSNMTAFHGVNLLLLSDDGKELESIAFDRASDAPAVPKGTKIPLTPAFERVLHEQKPLYIPDLAQDMLQYPELVRFASSVGVRSAYAFPVSTSRKKYGFVVFIKVLGGEIPAEQLELMSSVASHVATALESALAIDRAEGYQRDLARERDRLRLLLEINNHLVSKLDINELFRSASASIRAHFDSDFTAFWVIDKESKRLQGMMLDFPGTKGFLAETDTAELRDQDWEKLRGRRTEIWSGTEIEELPTRVAATLKAEGIAAVAAAPMVTGSGPLGLLAMGSRKADHFGQHDLDLLSQISVQISLALDNALAYGRLDASAARLEEERLYLESENSMTGL